MRFFDFVKATDIRQNELIFLSDVSKNDSVFSVDTAQEFDLGEVVSFKTFSDEIQFTITSPSGVYTVSAAYWHKFATYSPDKVPAESLLLGDKVLLRGEHSPLHTSRRKSCKILVSTETCESKVLKISKNRKGQLKISFLIAGVSKINLCLEPKSKMEIARHGYAAN